MTSTKSAVPVAAPRTLRYEQDAGLPVAIEARSNRRTFYPNNGNVFNPAGTNVIRLNLNSQSFVDFSHSYLQFKLTNIDAARTLGVDSGVPFFSRLQIMSGGQELEDIQEYSRLYSILQAAQGSDLNTNEHSLTEHNGYNPGLTGLAQADLTDATVAANLAGTNAKVDQGNKHLHNEATQVAVGGSLVYNIPLISGIFNIEKYFPLLLTEQGLDIYLYLNNAVDIGVWSGAPGLGYQIDDVKYIAHEVNLDDTFTQQMKASMGATGGVLSMSSTTYRYYQHTKGAGAGTSHTANISCRVKSLKGLIVRPQVQAINNLSSSYCISTGQAMGITELQFRVGSVLYPQSKIKFSNTNKGEMFQEIRKCFGTIGSYSHGTALNDLTFDQSASNAHDVAAGTAGSTAAGQPQSSWMAAYDFETFAKSATESGINVADRALPITMELTLDNGANTAQLATRFDIFAMCDCIVYIDMMGRITTRI